MVHPSALTGKTTHSLVDISNALCSLIFREYNKDARAGKVSYRDPGMKPLKKVYNGKPSVTTSPLPCAGVEFPLIVYEDSPQPSGSDNILTVKIYLYGSEKRREPAQKEAYRMVETVRHILLDNPTVPTAAGVEQVFQICYKTSRAEFDRFVDLYKEELIGVEVGIITAEAVFAEMGF